MPEHGLAGEQIEMLRRALAPFAEKIERVALFGSRATGKAKPNSDIDLVIYGAIDEAFLDRIWTQLNNCGLALKTDVVAYDLITHAALKEHIDKVERTLFTRKELRG